MNRLLTIARCCVCVAIVLMALPAVHAATVEASSRKGYGRINFNFPSPAKLKTSINGTSAVLIFDAPITQSAESIETSLPDYVQAATLSADKRTVTLTLKQPMRLRQFVSGNNVGVDLIESAQPTQTAQAEPATDTKEKPREETPPAEKPAAPVKAKEKAKEKPVVKEAKATSAPKEVKEPKKVVAAEAPLLTTKKSLPEKLSAAATAKIEDPILSTKHATSAAPEAAPTAAETTKKPAPAPVETAKPEQKNIETTKAEPVKEQALAKPLVAENSDALLTTKKPAPVAEAPAVEAPAKPAEPAKEAPHATEQAAPAAEQSTTAPATPAPEKTAEKPVPRGPFVVTARSANGETIINFPWPERTAAVVFQRSRDIWVVFSHAKNVNAGLLRTVLPKNIISVTQYAHAGNTVLRITTDGTLHASAKQAANGYGWNVSLSAAQERPTLDVSIAVDSLEGTRRVILGIFDVAPILKFYDPNAGEQLLVVPSFENGRAVNSERSFPEFGILASNQGVAIVAKRPDLQLNQTRSGLILSTKDGLAVSENLPIATSAPAAPPGSNAGAGVMMPYAQWFVAPDKYIETLEQRLAAVAAATKATKADSLMDLVRLYLGNGFGIEALGVLNLIHDEFPNYYTTNGLALLSAAANVMAGHMDTAANDLMAPELNDREEAQLWRQVVTLYAPPASSAEKIQQAVEANPAATDAAKNDPAAVAAAVAEAAKAPAAPAQLPVFQYLKFNKPFIRFYPPRIRQRLATIAADAYLADGQAEKALAVYDLLIRDSILQPVAQEAEFTLAKAAEKKGEVAQALEMYDRLATQTDNKPVAARARYSATMLRYNKSDISRADATEILEQNRIAWRGDALELQMLESLIGMYKDSKQYDNILRTQKALLEAFPNHPETLTVSGDMAELFENLFLTDAPETEGMEPLKALSLFYEFRELTPLGDKGDLIIQKLADRLAAIDLLDRATQLLENQIKFRATGESRSKIGARLALLHLLNKHPQEALNVLEVTNFGGGKPELQALRRQLTAEALTKLGKYEEALGMLYHDTTPTGAQLRLNTLWAMKDWTNIINRAEDILSARPSLTDPLNTSETETLLKLALAYCFEGDYTQLRYLRDYYSELIPDTAYKQIFDFITNDTTPLDPEDFTMLAGQITRTESFLDTFKAKIAAGKLSEAVQ